MIIKIITLNKDVPVTTIFNTDKVVATSYNMETNYYDIKFDGGNDINIDVTNVEILEWKNKLVWKSVEIAKDYDSGEFGVTLDGMIWSKDIPEYIGD